MNRTRISSALDRLSRRVTTLAWGKAGSGGRHPGGGFSPLAGGPIFSFPVGEKVDCGVCKRNAKSS